MFDKILDKISAILLEDSIAFITNQDTVPIVRFLVALLLIVFYLTAITLLIIFGIQNCIQNNILSGIALIAFALGICCLFGYFCYSLKEEMHR